LEKSNSRRRQNGFSLVEVTIATGILAGALATLGQMFAMSISSNRNAGTLTYGTVLAEQKIEQLRGLAWAFDNLGQPVSDAALSPSPPDTMTSNTPGWVDYIDRLGQVLDGGAAAPPKTVYTRRWAIEPLPSDPANTVVIHVLVTTRMNRGAADRPGSTTRLPAESRLVTIKTRKGP
jgi:type II secretory pathway pseudopilin PulG